MLLLLRPNQIIIRGQFEKQEINLTWGLVKIKMFGGLSHQIVLFYFCVPSFGAADFKCLCPTCP